LACVSSVALAQQGARSSFSFEPLFDVETSFGVESTTKPNTTPVPILRFLDTQNPDGSYTYGYESADGTYKIETRYQDGEVKGKYGYYDNLGTYREVEYGADTRGFIPSGEGLTSPQVVDIPTPRPQPQQPALTVEQPSVVLPTPAAPVTTAAPPAVRKSSSKGGRRRVVLRRRPIKKQQSEAEPETETKFAHFDRVSLPSSRRSGQVSAAPRRSFRPAAGERPSRRRLVAKPKATPAPVSRPLPPRAQALPETPRFNPVQPAQPVQPVNQYFDAFGGHPAQNIDLSTGSFSVYYSG